MNIYGATPIEDIVFGIQERLYYLSLYNDNIKRVNPDGIYSTSTEESVISFQHFFGLEENGRVDFETFTMLTDEYRKESIKYGKSSPIFPFNRQLSYDSASPGEYFDLVLFLQIMFNTISVSYNFPAIKEDGIYGAETASAIAQFQVINGLRSNGITDIHTWNALSDAYAKYLSAQ